VIRAGLGYDSHRLARGRKLILGGVSVPWPYGLKGHSDADVILHAVIDALLGAAGLGDIGAHFSDKDPRWRDVSSLKLLEKTAELLRRRYRVVNVDATLLAEAPRIGPYKQRMRAKIAGALGVPVEAVNVKAKTNEGMGFVGRRQGLAALAAASLAPRSPKVRR
jgi:2-C-methyl-D-erythritol 2,4-cyclodiphosphate synthase